MESMGEPPALREETWLMYGMHVTVVQCPDVCRGLQSQVSCNKHYDIPKKMTVTRGSS